MSRVTSRPRLLLAVAIGLAMFLMAETVVLAATTKSGGPVKAVKVVTESASQVITNSSSPTDIQGMSLSMTVPSGEKALLLITFSAQATCTQDTYSTAWCYVRVTVDGHGTAPGDVIFDGALDGNNTYAIETNSMQFVAGPVGAGLHTIKVVAFADEAASYFTLTNRTLSVLRSKV